MVDRNQTPEQKARDNIDKMLELVGWKVQNKKKIDFNAGLGVAVREFDSDVGPADYVSNSKCASEIGIAEAHGQGRDRER